MRRCALLFLAACGGGVAEGVDASADSPAAALIEVSCSQIDPAVVIGTAGGEYYPDPATVAVGDVVMWQLSAGHTAHSIPAGLFAIGQGEEACFRFFEPGDYDFYCQVHGFTGILHVE